MKKMKPVTISIIAVMTLLATFKMASSGGVVPWFRISDIPYNQTRPGLAYNSSSNQFLVVWEDFRGLGIGNDVYAQLVNDDGSMSGSNFPVSTANDWQRDPRPAYNPVTDKYLVVWEEWRNASDDIYAQQVNANGSKAGSEFTISTATNDQSNPDIVYNSSTNQFLVVFDDDRLVASDYNIYGKLVNADGSMSGTDFPISTPSENQLLPVVAYNSAEDQFLVVWEDDRNTATGADIYARLVNASGSMDGSDFPISTSNADQTTPDVAYDSSSNQFLVVWEHDTEIYGRLVRANKTFVGPEFLIATSSGSLSDPAVGYDTNSNQFLVAWSDSDGWDNIYARLVDAKGSMPDLQFDLATGKGDFFYPDMTFNASTNQFLVVWRHETCHSFLGCDDNDIDIFGALYRATAHFGLHLPLVLRDYSPPPPVPTATSTTSSPTPTSTATPTMTPTATPTSTPDAWVTILSEDFEGSFPGEWLVLDDLTGYGEYHWGKRNCRPHVGSYSGWAVGGGADGGSLACGSNYPGHADSWMIYGPFSLTDATDAELLFKAWVNTESPESMYDYFCRFASTDGTNFSGDCIWGNSSGWIDQVLDLTNVSGLGDLTGEPSVWVGLWFYTDALVEYAEGVYVDDILLRKCTSGGCSGSFADLPDSGNTGLIDFPAAKSMDLP